MYQLTAGPSGSVRLRWLWLAVPLVILLSMVAITMLPGMLIHWQGGGTEDRAPRPLTHVETVEPGVPLGDAVIARASRQALPRTVVR